MRGLTGWLAERLVPGHENVREPAVRRRYGALSGGVGILLNLLLAAGKLLAGALSGSVAMTADALNNLTDAASSVVTLIGFRVAGHKADAEHPFGHGRAEYVSGFLVSLLILLVAVGPDGRYYLYYVLDKVSVVSVAVCDEPAGKYEFYGYVRYPDGTRLGEREGDEPQFDPGVLSEGNDIWLYTGFCGVGDPSRTGAMVTRLAEDMLTVREAPKFIVPGSAT